MTHHATIAQRRSGVRSAESPPPNLSSVASGDFGSKRDRDIEAEDLGFVVFMDDHGHGEIEREGRRA